MTALAREPHQFCRRRTPEDPLTGTLQVPDPAISARIAGTDKNDLVDLHSRHYLCLFRRLDSDETGQNSDNSEKAVSKCYLASSD